VTVLLSCPVGGVISRSSSVLVEIQAPGDSNPQFLLKTYRGRIEEETDPGTMIVKVNFPRTTKFYFI
jgi:hypothetical protein